MTPSYYNPSFLLDLPQDYDHQDHYKLCLNSHILFNPPQDQEKLCYYRELQLQHEGVWDAKTYDHNQEAENKAGLKRDDEHEFQCLKSSKIKKTDSSIKKKASSPSETDHSNNSSYSNTIRVCSDCNTTKTPLWRSGPRGPKSLCNACGIRQRKARRAAAAAGTVAAAESLSTKKKVQHMDKRSVNYQLPFKKRCKLFAKDDRSFSRKKISFEDKENSACERTFPQELKDAAFLLMALSYGLVHG